MHERSGRHAVVTGGGTGVGAACAHYLAAKGAHVTILGRTEENLAAQSLPYQVCDVTKIDDVERAFGKARELAARSKSSLRMQGLQKVSPLPK